jgi:hypothetical protein
MERLVERAEPGAETALAELVQAAASERPRLLPHAVDRIEARLAELPERDAAGGRLWRALRVPAYVCAMALLAVLVWVPRVPSVIAPSVMAPVVAAAPSAAVVSIAPAATVASPTAHPLRLETGDLVVRTDGESAVVETPKGHVEVAPHSVVRITVAERGVRIAASAGSARVVYFDGRTELALPTVPAATRRPHPRATAPEAAVAPAVHVAPASAAPALDPERASLGAALGRLRSAPGEALGLLDAHVAHYPDGVTRPEAERARVAVLLRLSRKSDALAALDRVPAPSTELLVMRAELRAEAQRYDDAIGDFGAVLVADEDRFAQRALFGRAMARQRQGDRTRMSADLERFLLLYPRGELADRARTELRKATSESSR